MKNKMIILSLTITALALVAAITLAITDGIWVLAAALGFPTAEVLAQLAMIGKMYDVARCLSFRMSPITAGRLLRVGGSNTRSVLLGHYRTEYALIEELIFAELLVADQVSCLEQVYAEYQDMLVAGHRGWTLDLKRQAHQVTIAEEKRLLAAYRLQYASLLAG